MSLTVDSGQTLQRCLALDIGGTKIASAIVKNGEIEQRKQISTPQDDAAQAMHQTLAQLLKEYEGQFDYVAVASTGIINQGILTALNPKNLGGLAQFPLKDSIAQHTDKPIGVAQWLGGRKQGLLEYAKQKGKEWSDMDLQIDYLLHGESDQIRAVLPMVAQSKDVTQAASRFFMGWEIHGGGASLADNDPYSDPLAVANNIEGHISKATSVFSRHNT